MLLLCFRNPFPRAQQRKKIKQQGTVLHQSSNSTAQHRNISTARQDIAGKGGQATASKHQLRQAQENKDKQKQGKQGKARQARKSKASKASKPRVVEDCLGMIRVVRVGLFV